MYAKYFHSLFIYLFASFSSIIDAYEIVHVVISVMGL